MWHTHNSTVVERLCSPEIFNWIAPCKHLTFYCKLGERNLYWLIKSESVWPEFNATLKRNKIKNLVRHCCSLNDQDCTFTGCFPANSQPTSQHSEVLNSRIFFFPLKSPGLLIFSRRDQTPLMQDMVRIWKDMWWTGPADTLFSCQSHRAHHHCHPLSQS